MLPLANHFLLLFELLFSKYIRMKKPEKTFLILSGIQLFLLLALRGKNVGIDTHVYYKDIVYITNGFNVGFEIGDVFLIRVLYAISHSIQFVIAGFALLTILFLYFGIVRVSENKYISIFLYAGLMYYNFAFSGMRQALALSIVICAFSFMIEEKYIKTVLFIVLASLFHQSALIALVALLFDVLRKRIRVNMIIGISMVFYVLLWVFTDRLVIIGSRLFREYAWYVTDYEMASTSIVNLSFYLTIFVTAALLIRQNENDVVARERNIRYLIILAIGVALYIMATRFRIINRLTMYFTIIIIYMLPSIFEHNPNRRLLNKLAVVGASLYFTMLVLIKSNDMIPYYFFWDN